MKITFAIPKHTLLIAALGLMMSAYAQLVAQAQTFQINTLPYTVTVPGIYTLERNFTSTARVLITITSPDVTLDLGSHILTSTNPSTVACIIVKAFNGFGTGNVTIRNGTIRNQNQANSVTVSDGLPTDGIGVLIEGGGGNDLLQNVSISTSGSSAIVDTGGGNIIRNCIISAGHGGQPAIFLRAIDLVTANIIYPNESNIAVQTGHTVHAEDAIFGNVIYLSHPSPPGFNPVNHSGSQIPNTLDTVFRNPG
jgi:hypothetical protein